MPREWSDKDERQYDKIKKSAKQGGHSTERAKEIAARTVNKQRRGEGRTKEKTSQATGNPKGRLEDRTREELYNRAKELNISGRSNMGKSDLVSAIRRASH